MASYYFRNAGTDWGTAANWSLTDGGGATGAVPLVTDDAFFSNNSGNCTIQITNKVCKTIDFTKGTGYTGTVTRTTNLTIAGNITLSSGMSFTGAGNFACTATGSTLTSNGCSFNGYLVLNSSTYTLLGNWVITTLNTTGAAVNINKTTTETLTCTNGILNAGGCLGTAKIILTGGTWSNPGSGGIANDLEINGNHTISGTVKKTGGILLYTSGTTTGASTPIISFTAACTQTYNALFTAAIGMIYVGNQTVNGSNGFTITNLTMATAGNSHTFQSTNTYTVTGALIVTGTAASAISILSSTTSSATKLVLQAAGTQDVERVTATDIDSSGGQTIWNYRGTDTRTTNWNVLTVPTAIAVVY